MAERQGFVQQSLSNLTKKMNLGSSGHTLDGTYMPSIGEEYSKKKYQKKEKGITEKVGDFFNKVIGVQPAEGATLDSQKGFVQQTTGTGNEIASSLSAGSGGGYIDAGSRGFVSPEQATKMLTYPERFKMTPGELKYLRGSMPVKKVDASENKVYSDVSPSGGFFTGSGEGTRFASADIGKKDNLEAGFFSGDKESFSKFGSDNYQMSQNPDRTIMTGGEIMSSFSPTNIFNPSKNFIGGRFGTYDDPGTPLGNQIASDRINARESFNAPLNADNRTIAEIRRDQKQSQIAKAEERDRQFRETGVQTFGGKVQPRKSADDTFGTNMMSNPAFGFRNKMTAENQAKYDRSAAISTERAEVNPSIGNVITSTGNLLKRQVNKVLGTEGGTPLTREKPLQTKGEYQLNQANEFMNRSLIQRQRSADIAEGISMQDRIARNNEQMRLNAAARNQRFQADRRARAVERRARSYGQNTGTGRDGGFGTGTVGQGMPSNPNFRGPGNNKSANTGGGTTGGGTTGGGGTRLSGSDRAKAAYKRNIKKGHSGTASAAAANKQSMRDRARARHKAFKARRKKKKSKK